MLSENPTVSKLTRMVDERKRATEMERKSLKGVKEERKRKGRERAAGDEKFEMHLY